MRICRRRIGKPSSGCRLFICPLSASDVPSRKEESALQVLRCLGYLAQHQGYLTCHGVALACQQYVDRTPPVTVPSSAQAALMLFDATFPIGILAMPSLQVGTAGVPIVS